MNVVAVGVKILQCVDIVDEAKKVSVLHVLILKQVEDEYVDELATIIDKG